MKMSKKEFELKYYSMKNTELCVELGISKPTLLKYVDKLEIIRKGSGNRLNAGDSQVKIIFTDDEGEEI